MPWKRCCERSAAGSASGRTSAAAGIVRIANNNMVNALKLVSLNRGFDPREFTLVAFGGGGGMHAVALAGELGISKVVIPADAAVFSAWGMMMSDLRRDYIATRLVDLVPENAQAIENVLVETEDTARARFGSEGVDPGRLSFRRFGKFRYQNQEHTTEVALGEGAVTAGPHCGKSGARSKRNTNVNTPTAWMLPWRWSVSTSRPRQGWAALRSGRQELGPASADSGAEVFPEGRLRTGRSVSEAAIYDGSKLRPGMRFSGPAIVEDAASTVVVHRGNDARVDGFGNVVIHIHS